MSVLVWVHGHFWWLALGVVPCLSAIGWALWAGRYEPVHAGGPVPERLWPLVGDPRAGSMDLGTDQDLGRWPLGFDWREVAHEEDWRDQTRAALAPAVLDSGPGGLAWPGPDPGFFPTEWGARPSDDHGHRDISGPYLPPGSVYVCEPPEPEPEPEPVRTVAGRLVETSGEWLRRLERDAGPGWTYAGTVAA